MGEDAEPPPSTVLPLPRPQRRQRPLPLPVVGPRCTGCGRCVAACPPQVLWLEVRYWRKAAVLHDAPGCTGCARCERVCPFSAIQMAPAPG